MLAIVQAILTVAYPLLVWLALGRLSPRAIGLVLIGLVAIRLVFARIAPVHRVAAVAGGSPRPHAGPRAGLRSARGLWLPVGLVGLVAAGAAIANDPIGLLAAPVLVNAALFVAFAASLRGTPLVEQLARLQVDVLAPAEVRYCRRVTLVWCGFFVLNGAVAAALALRRDPAAWALYTGLLSYLLMGGLFAAEYVHRHARFRRYVGSFTDPLLSRLFPPRFTPEWLDEADETPGEVSSGRIALEVPTGLACWPGHFPGEPMVPGVVLVDWALSAIAHRRGRAFRPDAIDGLKFKQPVRPADRLELELTVEGGGEGGAPPAAKAADAEERDERIAFTFRRGEEVVAEGRFRRSAPAPAPTSTLASASNSYSSSIPAPAAPARARRAADAAPPRPEPAAILVHAPPMVWLAAVETHDARGTSGRVVVDALGAFREADGGVGAHVALEWMAQCVAAHAGLDRHARGEAPRLGLLLGTKRVRFARAAYTAGESFRVVASPSWVGDGGAAAFDCRVESLTTGEVVADARLSCFMPQDGQGLGAALRSADGNGNANEESGLPMSAVDPVRATASERTR